MENTARQEAEAPPETGANEVSQILDRAAALLGASQAARARGDSLLSSMGVTRTEARLVAERRGLAAHRQESAPARAGVRKPRRKTRTMV